MKYVRSCWFSVAVYCSVLTSVRAEWIVKPLASDLAAPRAAAIQPETQHIFVADTGRGRILRVVDGQVSEVVVGMAPGGTTSAQAPTSLLFLDAQRLLIGCAAPSSSQTGLFVVQLPALGASPLAFDATRALQVAWEKVVSPPGSWSHLTLLSRQTVLAVGPASSKESSGQLARMEINSLDQNAFSPIGRFLTIADPQCLTIAPRGEIVVGHREADTTTQAESDETSRLTIFRATDLQPLLQLPCGLRHLTGLVYSPEGSTPDGPLLYALDAGAFATDSTSDTGGLYRLDAKLDGGKQTIFPVKLLPLHFPTSITRGPDQSLLVTTLGPLNADPAKPSGQLLEIHFVP